MHVTVQADLATDVCALGILVVPCQCQALRIVDGHLETGINLRPRLLYDRRQGSGIEEIARKRRAVSTPITKPRPHSATPAIILF